MLLNVATETTGKIYKRSKRWSWIWKYQIAAIVADKKSGSLKRFQTRYDIFKIEYNRYRLRARFNEPHLGL
jgi:hypothetical protein